jgi:tRNA G10  N-methylase Trm11
MKERIFVGPNITQLLEDQNFRTKLNATEKKAWKEFENVCRKFRGNDKAENRTEIVQEIISTDSAMGCNTSSELHFLHSHLEPKHVGRPLLQPYTGNTN